MEKLTTEKHIFPLPFMHDHICLLWCQTKNSRNLVVAGIEWWKLEFDRGGPTSLLCMTTKSMAYKCYLKDLCEGGL